MDSLGYLQAPRGVQWPSSVTRCWSWNLQPRSSPGSRSWTAPTLSLRRVATMFRFVCNLLQSYGAWQKSRIYEMLTGWIIDLILIWNMVRNAAKVQCNVQNMTWLSMAVWRAAARLSNTSTPQLPAS